MFKRRHIQQTQSLPERLTTEAKELRQMAKSLAPGAEREAIVRKARQDETAAQMAAWLSSSGLKPPT